MLRKIFDLIVYLLAIIGLVLILGFFATKYGLTNTSGIIDNQRSWFLDNRGNALEAVRPEWARSEEWNVLEEAVRRDEQPIKRAGLDAGISPRLIVANLITEQLRLFFTERELYKTFFSPLKILGSQTQFSWGVMGMKEETAIQVENNLKDSSSLFYPGVQYEHLLDYPEGTTDIKQARFVRMTDSHDHYWSYLYAGLYMKEIEAQWEKSGFSVGDKPEIVSTLYNIGFNNSKPNSSPAMGGSQIQIGPSQYSFGSLAGEFYYSDLLTDIFPR